MKTPTVLLFLLSVILPAAEPNRVLEPTVLDKQRYTLGPGDEISVHVLDCQDIPEKQMRVDPDGQIALPLIGRIEAEGKSVSALELDITQRLRTYIRNPQVSINVTEFGSRPISVLGEVTAPGIYQLGGAKTLAEVISLAKGLAPGAGGVIRITRKDSSTEPERSASAREPMVTEVAVKDLLFASSAAGSVVIRKNDIITVPRAAIVYVIGEVKKPGAQMLNDRESITVLEALSAAEGVTPTGSPQHAKLLRRDKAGQRTEASLNIKRIMAGRADNAVLRPDDILVIPRNEARAIGLKTVDAAISLGTGALIYR